MDAAAKEERINGLMAKDDVMEDMKFWKMLEHLCILGDVRSRPGDDVPLVLRTDWALCRSCGSLGPVGVLAPSRMAR